MKTVGEFFLNNREFFPKFRDSFPGRRNVLCEKIASFFFPKVRDFFP